MVANPNDQEKVKILKVSLDELRRFFDHVSNIYDQLRVKALALIAGEVATATFIFSADNTRHIPAESGMKIFYFSGIVILGAAFGILLWIVASFTWKIPHDLDDSNKLYKKYNSELEFLEYLHDDFIGAIQHCLPAVDKKARKFNWAIYLLAAGIIMLLVIKYGGSPS